LTDKNIIKAAKTPDQLLKTLTTSFQWSRSHSQLVAGAVILFFLVGGGITLYDYLKKHKEADLQEKYYTLERLVLDKKKEIAKLNSKDSSQEASKEAGQDKANGKTKATPAPKPTTTVTTATTPVVEDYQKDYSEVVAKLEEIALQNPHSRAGLMAALQASDLLAQFKKDTEALDFLNKMPLKKADDLLEALTIKQKGNIQANLGQCKEAIATWNQVLASKSHGFLHPDVKLRQALCFETLKDASQAEKLYQELSQKTPGEAPAEENDLTTAKEAEKYLRLLRLNKGT
jgi:tetratricopeptide (TPR) repeat protein